MNRLIWGQETQSSTLWHATFAVYEAGSFDKADNFGLLSSILKYSTMKLDLTKLDEKARWVVTEAYKQGYQAYLTLDNFETPYTGKNQEKEAQDYLCGWCDAEGYADYVSGEGV